MQLIISGFHSRQQPWACYSRKHAIKRRDGSNLCENAWSCCHVKATWWTRHRYKMTTCGMCYADPSNRQTKPKNKTVFVWSALISKVTHRHRFLHLYNVLYSLHTASAICRQRYEYLGKWISFASIINAYKPEPRLMHHVWACLSHLCRWTTLSCFFGFFGRVGSDILHSSLHHASVDKAVGC